MSASILNKTEASLVFVLQQMQQANLLLSPCTVGPGHTAEKMTAPMLIADVKQVKRSQRTIALYECDVELYVVTQLDDETEATHDQRVTTVLAYLELQRNILFEVNSAANRPAQEYHVSGYTITDQQTSRVDRRFITAIRLAWNCS